MKALTGLVSERCPAIIGKTQIAVEKSGVIGNVNKKYKYIQQHKEQRGDHIIFTIKGQHIQDPEMLRIQTIQLKRKTKG